MKRKSRIVQEIFGHIEFRGQQNDVIQHTLSKKDSFVVMATGAYESLQNLSVLHAKKNVLDTMIDLVSYPYILVYFRFARWWEKLMLSAACR